MTALGAGGDEFGVALKAHTIFSAKRLAEELQQRFVAILEQCAHVVTCSTGAVIVPLTSSFEFQV